MRPGGSRRGLSVVALVRSEAGGHTMTRRLFASCFVSSVVFGAAFVSTQSRDAASPRLPRPAFHHLHMNSVDPSAAIDALMKVYRASAKVHVAGFEGIRSATVVTLLFTKVERRPPVPG